MGKNTKHDWALKMFLGQEPPRVLFTFRWSCFISLAQLNGAPSGHSGWDLSRGDRIPSCGCWGKHVFFFLFLTRLGDGFTMNPGRLSSWSSVASWIMSTSTGWIQQHRRIKQSDKAGLHYWPHLMEHRCKSWHTFWIRDLQLLPGLPLVYQVYSCRSPQRSEPPHLGALLRFLWRGARQHADIALDHLHKAGNSIGSDWCNVNRWWVTSSKRLHNYGTTHPFL